MHLQEEEAFTSKSPLGLSFAIYTHIVHTKRYTMFGVRKAINNVQVFEPSRMPLGISYIRPVLYSLFLASLCESLPLQNTLGPMYLRKCLGSNRKHIEGGYCNAVGTDCERFGSEH